MTTPYPTLLTIYPLSPSPFCCTPTATILSTRPPFANFSTSILKKSFKPINSTTTTTLTSMKSTSIDHVIHLVASSTSPELEESFSSRLYFVFEKEGGAYKEVSRDALNAGIFTGLVSSFQLWIDCVEHGREYQILRFDRRGGNLEEIGKEFERERQKVVEVQKVREKVESLREQEQILEGWGLKNAESSTRKVSAEKRRIWRRKISYGVESKNGYGGVGTGPGGW